MSITKWALWSAGIIGAASTLLAGGMALAGAMWMPDDEIAFVSYRGVNTDIFLMDVNHGLQYNLTHDDAYDVAPAWSPDGEWLAFVSDRDGGRNIYLADRFGRNPRRLTETNGFYTQLHWSSDGRSLTFVAHNEAPNGIYRVDIDGSNLQRLNDPENPRAILVHPDYTPGIPSRMTSPDGSRFALMTFRNQAWGIYVGENADPLDAHLLVDVGGFSEAPSWSPDGKRMVYSAQRDGLIDLFVIDVDGGTTPQRLTFNSEIDVSPTWRP